MPSGLSQPLVPLLLILFINDQVGGACDVPERTTSHSVQRSATLLIGAKFATGRKPILRGSRSDGMSLIAWADPTPRKTG